MSHKHTIFKQLILFINYSIYDVMHEVKILKKWGLLFWNRCTDIQFGEGSMDY